MSDSGSTCKRTAVLVGNIASGKTTLRQQMLGQDIEYAKTQAVEVFEWLIDTPGEYLEHGRLRHALQLISYEVDVVVIVVDASADRVRLPPGIATSYNRETLGVTTHVDLASEGQIAAAETVLRMAGARDVFRVNGLTGKGVPELMEAICRPSS